MEYPPSSPAAPATSPPILTGGRRSGIGLRATRYRPGHPDRDDRARPDGRHHPRRCSVDRRRRRRLRHRAQRGSHRAAVRPTPVSPRSSWRIRCLRSGVATCPTSRSSTRRRSYRPSAPHWTRGPTTTCLWWRVRMPSAAGTRRRHRAGQPLRAGGRRHHLQSRRRRASTRSSGSPVKSTPRY